MKQYAVTDVGTHRLTSMTESSIKLQALTPYLRLLHALSENRLVIVSKIRLKAGVRIRA